MKNSIHALLFVFAFGMHNKVNAQMAYDGNGDYKIFTGYINVGGKSGIEIQYDNALSELVSIGGKFNYLIKPGGDAKEDNSMGDHFMKIDNFLENYDAGLFVRFHFGPSLKIAETMDPYLGLDASFKSLGAHAGFKYKISDLIGLYGMYNYSFSSSLLGSENVESDHSFINYYGKSNAISFGLTFNLDY